jgi:hypothetical protein
MEFDRDQSRSNTHFDCEGIQSNIFDKSLSKSGSEFLASSSETSSTPTTNTRVVPGG